MEGPALEAYRGLPPRERESAAVTGELETGCMLYISRFADGFFPRRKRL